MDFHGQEFSLYLLTGLVAQLIGSLLGMGNGTISSAVLLMMGLPPAVASASSNTASFVTTSLSSWFHHKAGNIDKTLFLNLVFTGILGSLIGSALLIHVKTEIVKPLFGTYLFVLSLMIAWKTFAKRKENGSGSERKISDTRVRILGLIGGLLGALGGGGWGPFVNGQLVADGESPRFSVASSNAAKSISTLVTALTLVIFAKSANWTAIAGLILGGVIAAPIGAPAIKRMPPLILKGCMAALLLLLAVKIIQDDFQALSAAVIAQVQGTIL